MRIGYPCINRSIGCKADETLGLGSYPEECLLETGGNISACVVKILEFNFRQSILFFRVASDLVPFASHPISGFNWEEHIRKQFKQMEKSALKVAVATSHDGRFTKLLKRKIA